MMITIHFKKGGEQVHAIRKFDILIESDIVRILHTDGTTSEFYLPAITHIEVVQ